LTKRRNGGAKSRDLGSLGKVGESEKPGRERLAEANHRDERKEKKEGNRPQGGSEDLKRLAPPGYVKTIPPHHPPDLT